MDEATWACVVGKCHNKLEYEKDPDTGSLRPVRKFYAFPSANDDNSKVQLDGWILFVRKSLGGTKTALSWVPSLGSNICSAHFVREVKSDDPRKPNFLPTIFPNASDFPQKQIQYGLLDVISWWDQKGARSFPDLHAIVTVKEQKEPGKKKNMKPEQQSVTPELKSLILIEHDVESCVPNVLRSITIHEDLNFDAYVKGIKIPASMIFTDEDTKECKFHDVKEVAAGLHVFKTVYFCQGVGCGFQCERIPSRFKGSVINIDVGNGKLQSRVLSDHCEKFIHGKVCIPCKKLWNSLSFSLNRGGLPFKDYPSEVEETSGEKIQRLEKSIQIYKLEIDKRDNLNKSLKNRIGVLKAALVQEQNSGSEIQLGRIAARRSSHAGGNDDGCVVEGNKHDQGNQGGGSKINRSDQDNQGGGVKGDEPVQDDDGSRVKINDLDIDQDNHGGGVKRREPEESDSEIRIVHPSKIMEKTEPVRKVIRITPEQAAKLGKINPGGGNLIKIPISQLESIKQIINLKD
ncbi:unnamed protein product [Orchesella dallaii]|uniref:THAP-type domain-containing protein n=1 Tax=Orchesella dallaii TaxID=48710 RepID=A0ABP1REP5_9HEXA